MANSKNIIIGVAAAVVLIAGLGWFGKTVQSDKQDEAADQSGSGQLLVEGKAFDFGTISMANGNVSHVFGIKNAGAAPLTLTKLYTSCMCTAAFFENKDGSAGPYGMPGHGFVPKINKTLEAGEEAKIKVVFDPKAHGPAGVGPIERAVMLEGKSFEPLELRISAVVTP